MDERPVGKPTRELQRRMRELGGWRPNYTSDGPQFGGDDQRARSAGRMSTESFDLIRSGGVTDPTPYADSGRGKMAVGKVTPRGPATDDPSEF